MSDTKPSQLGNKYIFLNLIGVGGMAEVYRCKLSGQKGFEKIVALKKLLPQVAQDTVIVENFIDEARIAALLQHENIVHIYDFGELDGSYFIAMEYLFGKDLYSIIQRSKETGNPIGIENSLLIASKICEGMQYAHELKDLQQHQLNIIHRDLSPHNVFVTYDGKIKIIDFGIAKAELYDNRTKAGVIKGKISYMSPEQLCEKQIDLRSDIFSIGILLYEMLSGQRMFQGDTATLIRKCMQVDYENIEIVRPGLPPQLYDIVNRALQKDRTKRYQTCAEMREAIENCFFAMRRRPKTENLQKYIRQLFEQHFENERKILVTAIERSDEVHRDGKSGPHGDERLSLPGNDEGTLILDSGNIAGNLSGSIFQKVFLPAAKTVRRMTLVGFIACLTIIFLYINLSSTKIELDTEDGQKSEFTGLQPSKTDEESAQDLSQPPHEALVIKQEEKEISPQQREIDSLLDKADTAFRYKRLTVPEGDSAFTYYKKVLDISPANEGALDGLQQISDTYAGYAEKELSKKKIIEAQRNILKGLTVNPQSDRLSKLSARAEKEKKMLIKELAQKAQHSLEIDNLTSPPMDCAYKYYRDIRRLDHDNVIVENGIKKIADRYADLAEDSYRNLSLVNAREFVKKGLKVQSDHDRLLALQEDLSLSKPGIFFKMLQKNVQNAIDSK
jgi:serine/threonine protein kinase